MTIDLCCAVARVSPPLRHRWARLRAHIARLTTGLTAGDILEVQLKTMGVMELKSTLAALLCGGYDAPRICMNASKVLTHVNVVLFLCFVMYCYYQLILPFPYFSACAHRYG